MRARTFRSPKSNSRMITLLPQHACPRQENQGVHCQPELSMKNGFSSKCANQAVLEGREKVESRGGEEL